MLEKEAKQKKCPYMLGQMYNPSHREFIPESSSPYFGDCLGSQCMGWKRGSPRIDDGEPTGYCGLVDPPSPSIE